MPKQEEAEFSSIIAQLEKLFEKQQNTIILLKDNITARKNSGRRKKDDVLKNLTDKQVRIPIALLPNVRKMVREWKELKKAPK